MNHSDELRTSNDREPHHFGRPEFSRRRVANSPMTALSYPFALLPVVVVFGVLATVGVWVLAFASLVVLAAVALVFVVALGWGLVAATRALARRLTWHRAQRPAAANPRDS